MNNIVITENGVLYREKLFKLSEISDFLKIIPKKINIIISDEDILIKKYMNYDKLKGLDKLVEEDFFSGNGILIDNVYDNKKSELILYGIRDTGINIFYKNNIKSIIPIQKLVSDYLTKVNKIENSKFIFKFNSKVYFGLIENGALIEAKVLRRIDEGEEEDFRSMENIKEIFLEIKNKKILIS